MESGSLSSVSGLMGSGGIIILENKNGEALEIEFIIRDYKWARVILIHIQKSLMIFPF
jgi:hypothetical protein